LHFDTSWATLLSKHKGSTSIARRRR